MNLALAERTAELQAALADLRGFSRWVSHDLRAPLRAISSFGTLLASSSEERLNDRERHMLERIRQNSARMDNLITDILAYSTAQRTDVRDVPIDMELLARDVCDGMAESMGSDVELRVRTLPPAQGDPAMVSQALANLVGNALKFSRGTHEARVEIGARTIDGEIVYYVRDNGVGFDAAHADSLFAAFERLHGDQDFEGNGLGLAIVKQIVTRHGGRVWADGSPGIGATFYFTLPGPTLIRSALKHTY